MSDCIFCDIIAGKAPASFVYRDDDTLAFMDISSLNTGQVVVTTRQHLPYLADLDEAAGQRFFSTAARVARAIRNSDIPCDGVNLFLADGATAGQEVFHIHFLVIPRLKNDSMKITGEFTNQPRQKLDEMAARIKRAIELLH